MSDDYRGGASYLTPDLAPGKPSKNTFAGYTSKGDPDPTWWMTQVRKGIEFRKKSAFQGQWETWRKFYRGEYEEGYLPVNIFFKMIRTLVPRVYFRNPSISITATKPGDEYYALAQVLERIDNKLMRTMKVKQCIKAMTQNAFLYGTGIGKLGYGAEFTPTPDFLDASAPEGKKKNKFRVEYNDLVMPNMPWFLPTHPGTFVVPLGATDIHSARWVAHQVMRHVDDIKDDGRFKHTSSINAMRAHASEIYKNDRNRDDGTVELWEIRDKKSGMVFVLSPYTSSGGQKVLYQDHDEMMDEGHFPFFPLIFNNDDMVFWGLPDSKILDPQQRELNDIRTIMMKHRRASLVKVLVEVGSMSPDEAEKFINESVHPVVYLNEGGMSKVKVVDGANIPQGLLTMDALVEKDVQEILGLGSNQFGEYAPGSADRSATEANIVNQATQIRMDERRDAVADLLVDLMGQVHSVVFERWTGEQVVDLVGPGGMQIWVRFQPEELKHGGYSVSIDPDSTLPETKATKEQKAVQVYQLLSQNPLIEPHKLTAYLLRAFHGAEYDDMMIDPQQAELMKQQAMQKAGLPAGMHPGAPMDMKQYQAMLPQLRAIQGGKGRVPQNRGQ